MKKHNPLFNDSTKSSGDSISTQVELSGIFQHIGEEVYVRVTDKAGNEQTAKLERKNSTQVVGYVFLRHQMEITYQFFMTRNGRPVFMTKEKTIKSSYLLEDKWEPITADDSLNYFINEEEVDQEEVAEDATQVDELVDDMVADDMAEDLEDGGLESAGESETSEESNPLPMGGIQGPDLGAVPVEVAAEEEAPAPKEETVTPVVVAEPSAPVRSLAFEEVGDDAVEETDVVEIPSQEPNSVNP